MEGRACTGQTLSSPDIHVQEHTIEVAGAPVVYHQAGPERPTIVYLHSTPTSSGDWRTLLERTGGVAPDLPGFGRSGKGGHLQYTLPAYLDFLASFLDGLSAERSALVGHGWGAAVALAFAQRSPERVSRLVLVNAVPLLPGFQWPRLVRRVLPPGIGELWMGVVTRRGLARLLRSGAVSAGAWPEERVAAIWEQFDQGTQRAFLRLHRSIDAAGLARAGSGLELLHVPTLVIWGERDPWLAPTFADDYVDRLPGASLLRIRDAGHWPWLDQPSAIEPIVAFLGAAA